MFWRGPLVGADAEDVLALELQKLCYIVEDLCDLLIHHDAHAFRTMF